MITNHYGKWVDSESPVTGVINSNNVALEFITDICLTCEEIYESIENNESLDYDEKQYLLDFIECDSSHTKIFGDWIFDAKTKQYDIDKNGEFSAIENESTVQIIWSKYTKHGALCSPCYPGQVDLDSSGSYLGYTLPKELLLHKTTKKYIRAQIWKFGVWKGIVNHNGKLVYATITCIATLHDPDLLEFYNLS